MSEMCVRTEWPCHSTAEVEYLASGLDSHVYRVGSLVVKHYRVGEKDNLERELTPEHLEVYFELTKLVHEFSMKNQLKLHLFASRLDIPIVVNQMLTIHKCDCCGTYEGLAPYIPGRRVDDAKDLFDRIELRTSLTDFNSHLEQIFGYKGITVAPVNLKIPENGFPLIATDLCADIRGLRKVI